MRLTATYLAVITVMLMVTAADAAAGLKISSADIEKLESVAVVGYSFFRDVDMEPASPFKLKREVVQLQADDQEFKMLQVADDRVMEAIRRGGTFTLMDPAAVLTNEIYISSTKDPNKKLIQNWYFPEGYRDIKLKKKNAIALCEALGVDAVVQLSFKHSLSSTSSSTLGVFNKKTEFKSLKGEITMIDKNGKTLISGSLKSEKFEEGTTRSYSIPGNGVEINPDHDKPAAPDLFDNMLNGYMMTLSRELGHE